jgi:3-oxoacyl-[acyl-carrier protein] reductase
MSDALRSIRDRVAIVTGAASGMGRATASLFAAEGASVGLLDRPGSPVHDVVASIVAGSGGRALAVEVDLADTRSIPAAVDAVRGAFGPIDILVNNAGVPAGATFDAENFYEVWDHTFAVNLTAQVEMVRSCLADLLRNGDGRIVNIASTEALGATPRTAPYTASKHGVVGLTRSLAIELGRRGVTANCVCPGPILTGMTEAIPEDARNQFARRRVPAGRYGRPEEIAHMVLALVMPGASYVNGAVIPVDGGMTASSR